MRITKLFTCVVAALTVMYSSGCCERNTECYPFQQVAGYSCVPQPVVGCQPSGITYQPAAYASAPVDCPPAPRPRKAKKTKAYKKGRRPKCPNVGCVAVTPHCYDPAAHAGIAQDPCLAGYTVNYGYPGYGTAALLTNSDVVPIVVNAPATMDCPPAPAAPAFAPPPQENCRTVYRKGRRPNKEGKIARPDGYVPYTVNGGAMVSEPYTIPVVPLPTIDPTAITPVYAAPLSVTYEPAPYAEPYTPEPAPVAEPDPEPMKEAAAEVAPAKVETPQVVSEPVIRPVIEPMIRPVIEPVIRPIVEETQNTVQKPIVQPIVIQPVIQPIVRTPIRQMTELPPEPVQPLPQAPAPILTPAPPPPPAPVVQAPVYIPEPAPAPMPPPAPVYQAPIVSEPLSQMVSVPGAIDSGFESGILGSYCPPDICPVPSAVLCQPGQNLSDCFTLNDYQVQNTPAQILVPTPNEPLFAPVPVPAPVYEAASSGKYQALTPQAPPAPPAAPRIVAPAPVAPPAQMIPPVQPQRPPEARRPEVMMPAPIPSTSTMPLVPATSEIESALDAMVAPGRTPLK